MPLFVYICVDARWLALYRSMARPKSKFQIEEVALNLFIPKALAAELEAFIQSGPGGSRPKKLLVGTAIMQLIAMKDSSVNEAVRRFQAAYLCEPNGGGAPTSAQSTSRPTDAKSSPASRRAG